MGLKVIDYVYKNHICVKRSDVTPKRHGLSKKEIDSFIDDCFVGYVETGGMGHIRHVKAYSLYLINENVARIKRKKGL